MDIKAYPHTMPPFDHQKEHLEKHYKKKSWGLLWEQGTAKTKPIIDTGVALWVDGEIDAMVVVAPSGVERNWKSDEFPAHLPAEYALDWMIEFWHNAKKHTLNHKQLMHRLLTFKGMAVLLISYDAFMTAEGKKFIWKFLQKRRCLYVLDEAHNIKTPKAKRTISIIASGKYAPYRRILTGTPISLGPTDIYTQIRFLDEYYWKNRGIDGAVEFRNRFCEYYTDEEFKKDNGYARGYDELIGYRNIDELSDMLKGISDRLVKDDVLDLPPKLYTKRYFDMSREQTAAYKELKDNLLLDFGDGRFITATLPIVMLLRLQQIACNYVPVEEGEPYHMFSKRNPRMGIMEDIRDETHRPAIVWARFTHDIDQLMDMLGKDAVRYDGTLNDDEAERSKLAFQRGDAKWFVGNAQKGGSGLTLTQAKTVVYYSNSFRLIDRLQSEDRAHRGGMDDNAVDYIDLIANGTVDERIVQNLRGKRDISAEILGDSIKEWI